MSGVASLASVALPAAAGSPVRAQLAVQRSGQLDWLRRSEASEASDTDTGATGELWALIPEVPGGAYGAAWRAERREAVGQGTWLGADASGLPHLVQLPAAATGAGIGAGTGGGIDGLALTAALWQPRTGSIFLATEAALEEHLASGERRVHAVGVAAMALSTDLRRIYSISPAGELWVTPAVPASAGAGAGEGELTAPERLLAGLDRHGAVTGLAVGPAGLVLVAERAVFGVNVRSLSSALIFELATSPLFAELRRPAIAVDHRRTIYLADDRAIACARGDGSDPRSCFSPAR